jgi:cytochrome c biogenesis protein CcmG/thiol:disulfide interchange protein DsbE
VSNKPSRQSSASAKVRAASASGGGGNTTWLWIGIVVVIVLVGVIVIAVGRSSSGGSAEGGGPSPSGGTVVPNGDVEFGTVEVSGTQLPQPSDSGADAGVGMQIPTIDGITFDDSAVTISPDGEPKVILALAHWCPHCQREVPLLQEWLDENGMPSDVEVVAVATGNDSGAVNFPAGDWLREEGWSVPTMVDDQDDSAALALGVKGYPGFTVVDADGEVVFRTSGEISMDQWEALLESARTGVAPTA